MRLNEIIKAAIPAKMRASGGHPSKRDLSGASHRMYRELEVLKESLDSMIHLLNSQGRTTLYYYIFHSLEDRIVKNFFREMEIRVHVRRNFQCVSVGNSLWEGDIT